MTRKHTLAMALSAVLMAGTPLLATSAERVMVVPKAELKWKDMGNGVSAAPVWGNMDKGASRFFLKYPVGFVTPRHHHNANHYVALVSGTVMLNVAGKDYRLEPGSYFALKNKAPHTAKVEGNEAAVFFIQADGPWNVVMEKEKGAQP